VKFPKFLGGIGLLSYVEIETGIPLADELKLPEAPVFILHGGDHFTILFSAEKFPTDPGSEFTVYHWNGLPPAGPRMCTLKINAVKGSVGPAPETYKETFYKPEIGEIDDVVQAHTADKQATPQKWMTWRFEVVLAVDDPDVKGALRPPDVPSQPKFEFQNYRPSDMENSPWRCACCYAGRYKTMCFGQNSGGKRCQYCGKTREEAGWSFYLHYDELPPKMQRVVTRRHAPKIVTLLRTKWPGSLIQWDREDAPPSV